jgi:hypothetical protein
LEQIWYFATRAMTKLEKIEREIAELEPEELARLRAWFEEFDAVNWDAQIEADAQSGKLDAMAEKALKTHRAGRTRPL